jgi:shikimate dehydrogenase
MADRASLKRYAVVGNPIAHSLSPAIHRAFAQQTGVHLQYDALLAPVDDFEVCIERFFGDGGAGVNVTVPFKLRAHALVDELDDAARAAGAVNTIAAHDGILTGYNTDGTGLLRDLSVHQQAPVTGRRVLVLGAGGAVQGVLPSLSAARPRVLDLHNRTHDKAQVLAARHGAPVRALTTEQLQAHAQASVAPYDIVINGTAASLSGEVPPIPAQRLREALCYDMVYGRQTAFLRFAQSAGARRCVDGLGMLVEQAAAAFEIWHGIMPATPLTLLPAGTQKKPSDPGS